MPDPEENEITSVSQDDIDQLLKQGENETNESVEPPASDEPDTLDEAEASEESVTKADALVDTEIPSLQKSNESGKETGEAAGESEEIESLKEIDQSIQPEDDPPEDADTTESPTIETGDLADGEAEPPEEPNDPDDSGEMEPEENVDDIDKLLELEGDASDKADESDAFEDPSAEAEVDGINNDDTTPSEDVFVDDIDRLLEDEADAVDMNGDDTTNQVILEDVPREKKTKRKRSVSITWRPQKRFLISIAVLVAIGTAFNILIARHGRQHSEPIKPVVFSFPISKKPSGTTDSTFQESPRSVYLKGFIVPAPLKRKDINYVVVDVGLELATEAAAAMIKDQAPFFRSIIYGVMLKALQSLDKSKINQVGLKLSILSGLNGELPDRSVKDVIVDAFFMY